MTASNYSGRRNSTSNGIIILNNSTSGNASMKKTPSKRHVARLLNPVGIKRVSSVVAAVVLLSALLVSVSIGSRQWKDDTLRSRDDGDAGISLAAARNFRRARGEDVVKDRDQQFHSALKQELEEEEEEFFNLRNVVHENHNTRNWQQQKQAQAGTVSRAEGEFVSLGWEKSHPTYRPKRPIKQIALLGERNSGTTWMTAHLQKCFNSTNATTSDDGIPVRDYLVRYKHFFQDNNLRSRQHRHVEDTLVIAMFRNPYHWIEAMRDVPHHAPMHYHKSWQDFLTIPWTMPKRCKSDLALVKELQEKESKGQNSSSVEVDLRKIKCQFDFRYHEIDTCLRDPFLEPGSYEEYFKSILDTGKNESTASRQRRLKRNLGGSSFKLPGYSGKRPQYELRNDQSGLPYNSILELRADKITNFLDIATWDWVSEFRALRYEDLLARGTAFVIEEVERLTGVKANCQPSPAQNRPQRELPEGLVTYMKDHVDWEVERRVGYRELSFLV